MDEDSNFMGYRAYVISRLSYSYWDQVMSDNFIC